MSMMKIDSPSTLSPISSYTSIQINDGPFNIEYLPSLRDLISIFISILVIIVLLWYFSFILKL
jgi:hypothetical protein